VLRSASPDAPYAVPIDFLLLAEHSPQSAGLLLKKPNEVLAELEAEIMLAQDTLIEGPLAQEGMHVKEIVRPRLLGPAPPPPSSPSPSPPPPLPPTHRPSLRPTLRHTAGHALHTLHVIPCMFRNLRSSPVLIHAGLRHDVSHF
jgi:hypothetical protein